MQQHVVGQVGGVRVPHGGDQVRQRAGRERPAGQLVPPQLRTAQLIAAQDCGQQRRPQPRHPHGLAGQAGEGIAARGAGAFLSVVGDGYRKPAGLRVVFSPCVRGNQPRPRVVAYVNTTGAHSRHICSTSASEIRPAPRACSVWVTRLVPHPRLLIPVYCANDLAHPGVPPCRSHPFTRHRGDAIGCSLRQSRTRKSYEPGVAPEIDVQKRELVEYLSIGRVKPGELSGTR